MQGTYLRDEISKAGRGEWYAKKVLTALKMHGELQGICLGAEGDPLGVKNVGTLLPDFFLFGVLSSASSA